MKGPYAVLVNTFLVTSDAFVCHLVLRQAEFILGEKACLLSFLQSLFSLLLLSVSFSTGGYSGRYAKLAVSIAVYLSMKLQRSTFPAIVLWSWSPAIIFVLCMIEALGTTVAGFRNVLERNQTLINHFQLHQTYFCQHDDGSLYLHETCDYRGAGEPDLTSCAISYTSLGSETFTEVETNCTTILSKPLIGMEPQLHQHRSCSTGSQLCGAIQQMQHELQIILGVTH